MADAVQIRDLFAWFAKHEIKNRQNVEASAYLAALKDLGADDLRVGCEAMQKAKFQVMLTPQDFRSLCTKQWVPASRDRRAQAVAEMRRILGRRA